MQVPLEITYRNVPKTEAIDALVRRKAAALERFCDYITSCRIAIEKPQEHQRSGSSYRVRLDITVPPGHEIVVIRDSGEGELHDEVPTVVRNAFGAARRKLQKLVRRQRGEVKMHPQHQVMGFVVRLFKEEGYGFIKTLDDREIYFHRNSVLGGAFERLEVGTGTRFSEEAGEQGPQASTVQIVDKPGVRVSEKEPEETEPPLGWKR